MDAERTRAAPLRCRASQRLSGGTALPGPALPQSLLPDFRLETTAPALSPAPVSPVAQPATRASCPVPGAVCCWTGRGLGAGGNNSCSNRTSGISMGYDATEALCLPGHACLAPPMPGVPAATGGAVRLPRAPRCPGPTVRSSALGVRLPGKSPLVSPALGSPGALAGAGVGATGPLREEGRNPDDTS